MTHPTLFRLLDDNVRFDLGGRGTVNHLPMGLIALSRLGAEDGRLIEYFEWWEENRALPRRISGGQVNRSDWQRYIGQPPMFDALSRTFRDWIIDCGSAEVIGEVFPALSRGVAAAAFHGLIRLAYGIDADHPGEMGAGLAALCSRHVELREDLDRAPASSSAEASLAAIEAAIGGVAFIGEGIIGRMRAAAADPRFVQAFSLPPIGPALIADLARIAIALYWQTGDFTVLHMVTATHAARLLFERFPQLASSEAMGSLWEAACAAYASTGAPRLWENAPSSQTPPQWDQIIAQAIRSNDDHVIKMTYTCHCEEARYGGPLYQISAARLAIASKA